MSQKWGVFKKRRLLAAIWLKSQQLFTYCAPWTSKVKPYVFQSWSIATALVFRGAFFASTATAQQECFMVTAGVFDFFRKSQSTRLSKSYPLLISFFGCEKLSSADRDEHSWAVWMTTFPPKWRAKGSQQGGGWVAPARLGIPRIFFNFFVGPEVGPLETRRIFVYLGGLLNVIFFWGGVGGWRLKQKPSFLDPPKNDDHDYTSSHTFLRFFEGRYDWTTPAFTSPSSGWRRDDIRVDNPPTKYVMFLPLFFEGKP